MRNVHVPVHERHQKFMVDVTQLNTLVTTTQVFARLQDDRIVRARELLLLIQLQ